MSVLLPWLLAVGAVAVAGIVALHLLSRDEPPRWLLPTARFVPRSRERAPARSLAPSDRALLALRVIALVAIALAAARPWWHGRRAARAQVIVADLARTTADRREVAQAVRAAWRDGDRVVVLDSVPRRATLAALESLAVPPAARARGRLSAALLVAREEARTLARSTDSVALVIVSPLVADGADAATMPIRATWPGGIRLVKVTARAARSTDRAGVPVAMRGDLADPMRATLALDGRLGAPIADGAAAVRLVRAGSLTPADSAAARAGATVVLWPESEAPRDTMGAVATARAVFVATIPRAVSPLGGVPVAHWVDGAPAASEVALGSGCIRRVSIPIPATGDAALRASFRAVTRDLLAPCGGAWDLRALDSAALRAIEGSAAAAPSAGLVVPSRDAPLVRWLLLLAALALGAEWWLRRRTEAA